jgi:hypothetical protein
VSCIGVDKHLLASRRVDQTLLLPFGALECIGGGIGARSTCKDLEEEIRSDLGFLGALVR